MSIKYDISTDLKTVEKFNQTLLACLLLYNTGIEDMRARLDLVISSSFEVASLPRVEELSQKFSLTINAFVIKDVFKRLLDARECYIDHLKRKRPHGFNIINLTRGESSNHLFFNNYFFDPREHLRLKSQGSYTSFSMTGGGFRVGDKYLVIEKIGFVSLEGRDGFVKSEESVKTLTIKRKGHNYQAIFKLCEET